MFLLILNFIIPICSFAIDEDSIYVWSNNSPSISTSNAPAIEEQENTTSENNSRKFFKHYVWKLYIDGSKKWNNSI